MEDMNGMIALIALIALTAMYGSGLRHDRRSSVRRWGRQPGKNKKGREGGQSTVKVGSEWAVSSEQ